MTRPRGKFYKHNKTSPGPYLCSTCGKTIPKKVVDNSVSHGYKPKYCSQPCRRYEYNVSSLRDPRNNQEAEEFDRHIQAGKEELRQMEMIGAKLPEDDSPEAERKLREELCPNPLVRTNDVMCFKYEQSYLNHDLDVNSEASTDEP